MATSELPRSDLVKLIRAMQADIDLLRRQSPLSNTGLSVSEVAVVQVEGAIQSANYVAGVSGWRFDGASLEVNTGVIGNAALANPVAADAIYATATGFALYTGASRTLATATLTVPPGFSRAVVSVIVRVFAYNSSTQLSYMYARATIGSVHGYEVPLAATGNNGSGTSVAPMTQVLTGLTPGDTFPVSVGVAVDFANWPANSQNVAEASGTVLWFR